MKDENYKENCGDWKHSQGHWVHGLLKIIKTQPQKSLFGSYDSLEKK